MVEPLTLAELEALVLKAKSQEELIQIFILHLRAPREIYVRHLDITSQVTSQSLAYRFTNKTFTVQFEHFAVFDKFWLACAYGLKVCGKVPAVYREEKLIPLATG